VIILVINDINVAISHFERDAPVAGNGDRLLPLPVTGQWMKKKSRQINIVNGGCMIQNRKAGGDFVCLSGVDAACRACFKKSL
jgi:hypothetical protein